MCMILKAEEVYSNTESADPLFHTKLFLLLSDIAAYLSISTYVYVIFFFSISHHVRLLCILSTTRKWQTVHQFLETESTLIWSQAST
jgi:hypothetical protein